MPRRRRERPYRLGEGAREVPSPSGTTEFAAASRPQAVETVERRPLAEPAVSPVSAYAPTRYDGRAGFMSGRGLY